MCLGNFKISTYVGFIIFYFIITAIASNEFEAQKLNTLIKEEHHGVKYDKEIKKEYRKTKYVIYRILLGYANRARSYLLFPLLRLTAIICLAYDIAIPSMALNALGLHLYLM